MHLSWKLNYILGGNVSACAGAWGQLGCRVLIPECEAPCQVFDKIKKQQLRDLNTTEVTLKLKSHLPEENAETPVF